MGFTAEIEKPYKALGGTVSITGVVIWVLGAVIVVGVIVYAVLPLVRKVGTVASGATGKMSGTLDSTINTAGYL